MENKIEDMSFKEGLMELDSIVKALESNQLELEQSIESYERGVALLGALKKRLDTAQQKVVKLSKGPDGTPVEEDFLSEEENQ